MLLLIEPTMAGDGGYYLHAAQYGPDLFRPPLYGLFLAPFLHLGGLIYVAQSALTIGAAILCLCLTRSLWAAAAIACCPFLIVYEYSVLSETLLIGLLLSGWLLLDHGKPILAGMCLGLAILTNDVFLLLPLFSLPFGVALGKGRSFVTMALAAYLIVAPWAGYNLAAHDRLAVSEGRMGFNLWVGAWERDPHWVDNGISAASLPDYAFRSQSEKTVLLEALAKKDDATFKRVALDRIKADPVGTAATWAKRYWRLWLGTRTDQVQLKLVVGSPSWTAFKSAMWGLNVLLLVAGVAGLVVSRRWIFAIPVLYVVCVYVPFHNTETRYSLPAMALLLALIGRTKRDNRTDALGLPIVHLGFQDAARSHALGRADNHLNVLFRAYRVFLAIVGREPRRRHKTFAGNAQVDAIGPEIGEGDAFLLRHPARFLKHSRKPLCIG